MADNQTPQIPAGMVRVSQEEFFRLLKADKRDIMPSHTLPDQTSWETAYGRTAWGWSTPGWKNPGAAIAYAVVSSVKDPA